MDSNKNDSVIGEEAKIRKSAPGDGIRSLKSSYAFRLINYELYVKPSKSSSNFINSFEISTACIYILWLIFYLQILSSCPLD